MICFVLDVCFVCAMRRRKRVHPSLPATPCPMCLVAEWRGKVELPCGHAMCSRCFVSHVEHGNGRCHLCRAPLERTLPPPSSGACGPHALVHARQLSTATLEQQVTKVIAQHLLAHGEYISEVLELNRLSPDRRASRTVHFLQSQFRLVMLQLLVRLERHTTV